jgi:hypothetical protein
MMMLSTPTLPQANSLGPSPQRWTSLAHRKSSILILISTTSPLGFQGLTKAKLVV